MDIHTTPPSKGAHAQLHIHTPLPLLRVHMHSCTYTLYSSSGCVIGGSGGVVIATACLWGWGHTTLAVAGGSKVCAAVAWGLKVCAAVAGGLNVVQQ